MPTHRNDEMPPPRESDASSGLGELIVIEDENAVRVDAKGNRFPSFRFVADSVVRAHPMIIDRLLALQVAEPLWTMDQVLDVTSEN